MSSTAFSSPAGQLAAPEDSAAWLRLKDAATAFAQFQEQDGSVPEEHREYAAPLVETVRDAVAELAPAFGHDAEYLDLVVRDLDRWLQNGLGVPDFLDSLLAFQPQLDRTDGLLHLVVFPMYTQNGSRSRLLEAVLVEVIWPDFIANLEAGEYSNKL